MWILLSLGTAVCTATTDALIKVASRTNRVQTLALVRFGYAAALLLPFLPHSAAPIDLRVFWGSIAIALPLELAGAFCYQGALKIAPLSLTVPYLAFTPVFVLMLGWVFLHETATVTGVAGILLVTAGAFFLQTQRGVSPLETLRALPRERGSMLMLTVALLYAFTSSIAKRALLVSSPLTLCATYYSIIALGLIPFQFGSANWMREIVSRPWLFLAIGATEACGMMLQFYVFQTTAVAYAISIKRLSLLFAVLYGRFLFKESHLVERGVGALLMVGGAILIAFH
jgi:drug/metabolite transporter (DMT)-like permease